MTPPGCLDFLQDAITSLGKHEHKVHWDFDYATDRIHLEFCYEGECLVVPLRECEREEELAPITLQIDLGDDAPPKEGRENPNPPTPAPAPH